MCFEQKLINYLKNLSIFRYPHSLVSYIYAQFISVLFILAYYIIQDWTSKRQYKYEYFLSIRI